MLFQNIYHLPPHLKLLKGFHLKCLLTRLLFLFLGQTSADVADSEEAAKAVLSDCSIVFLCLSKTFHSNVGSAEPAQRL